MWCLGWVTVTALVPEISELVSLGRPELAYRTHNFELSWGMNHLAPAGAGIVLGLALLRRAPIFSALAIVALTTEAAFAILDYRRNGFLGNGEGRISSLAYVLIMLGSGLVFGSIWFVRYRMRVRKPRG